MQCQRGVARFSERRRYGMFEIVALSPGPQTRFGAASEMQRPSVWVLEQRNP
jgi:hypothetical protein